MIVIKNDYEEYFCNPATGQPYEFTTYEETIEMIEKLRLEDAYPVEEDQ